MPESFRQHTIGEFLIRVVPEYDVPDFLSVLTRLRSAPECLIDPVVLQAGRHRVVRAKMRCGNALRDVVVKTYGRQAAWRDFFAKRGKGSKAQRAFDTAVLLKTRGIGTPPPIALAEKWSGNRLVESHFISEYVPELSDFRKELNRVLHGTRDCVELMTLTECVARAVRKLHDAGVVHRDLGNQNIGLRKAANGSWNCFFIDLNRAETFPRLTEKQRGKDLARLDIPSAILSEFFSFYGASGACRKAEARERVLFGIHSKLRPFRHPLREYRLRRKDGGKLFFSISEEKRRRRRLWIWDECSAQAIPAFNSKDRRRLRPLSNIADSILEWLRHGRGIFRNYSSLSPLSFSEKISFAGTIGMALDANPCTWNAQLKWLEELQGSGEKLPVLLRIYRHKGRAHQEWTIARARELSTTGHSVAFALVQDREAILHPEKWREMLDLVFAGTHDFADFYEIGHATNRGKWGIWDFAEYARLLAPATEAKKKYPEIRLSGPACIDFDLHSLPALLARVPAGTLDALSQHLYVDRRGAPENFHGKFDTVGKCALHRAFARTYRFKEEKIIVSEVNWPIVDTGRWSPVGSPYTAVGPKSQPPSATEENYAKFMCRYLLLAVASGHAARVYWWRLAAKGYGLIDDGGDAAPETWRARPAFHALKNLLAQLAGTRFERRLTDVPAGTFALEFSRADGSRFTFRWTMDSLPEIG